MSGIGAIEFIVIAIVLLVFVGPKHMPVMLRKLGRIIGDLRNASRDLRNQFQTEIADIPTPTNVARDIKDGLLSPYEDLKKEVELGIDEAPDDTDDDEAESDEQETEEVDSSRESGEESQ